MYVYSPILSAYDAHRYTIYTPKCMIYDILDLIGWKMRVVIIDRRSRWEFKEAKRLKMMPTPNDRYP